MTASDSRAARTARNHAHRPSRLALARQPARALTRHGCRLSAYKDVLAACPARVGGQGPCNQAADQPAAHTWQFCEPLLDVQSRQAIGDSPARINRDPSVVLTRLR